MKFSFLLFILFLGCNTKSEEKIREQQTEIERLKDENRRLSIQKNSYQSENYNQYNNPKQSNESSYSLLDEKSLIEEFKNYMADQYFIVKSFRNNNKTIRVRGNIVTNIDVRQLQRNNPSIFNELLIRYEKIIFYDDFGSSITVNKR